MPELKATIHHDPEADMYCAYSTEPDALRTFILKFREICDNDSLIKDLFLSVETE